MGLFDKIFSGGGKPKVGGKAQVLDVPKRFEVNRHAFHGTMSKFHMVTDYKTNEVFGIKLLDTEKTRLFRDRFKGMNAPKEGEIGTEIDHPLIAKTFQYGKTHLGQEYILTEWVNGPGMNVLIKNQAPELKPVRLMMIKKMAEALMAVHDAGFIHRDICPRNYICTKDLKNIKLIDFGLTVPDKPEFCRPGNRTGTPQYMSPEVIRRRPTDNRLDIFSFGVTMYRMLSFEHPWGSTDTTGMAALAHDQRPATDILKHRPDMDENLAKLVNWCLKINKDDRMPSMKRLLQELRYVRTEDRE